MTSGKTTKVANDLLKKRWQTMYDKEEPNYSITPKNVWDGENEEANKLWDLMVETPDRVTQDLMRAGLQPVIVTGMDNIPILCMICNDGKTEATHQLPNQTGLYVCYGCKIVQREVIE